MTLGRKYDEDEVVAQLRDWLAPKRVSSRREPATDTIRVRVFDDANPDAILVDGYAMRLPMDEVDLRTHANNLRSAAGLPELPPDERRGFFGDQ